MTEIITHVGVYAKLCRAGRTVLIHKGRGPYTGQWDLPGGRVEAGETPAAALRREVAEETGLRISAIRLLLVLSNRISYSHGGVARTLLHVGFIYQTGVEADALRAGGDGQDSLEARWLEDKDLPAADLTPFARAVLMRPQ